VVERLIEKLRSVRPTSVAVVVVVVLAGGAYALWGGQPSTLPLSERVADCLDDYFSGVDLDPAGNGQIEQKAELGGIYAADAEGDEAELGVEGSTKAAERLAAKLKPLKVEQVGAVLFVYRGGSGAEREVVARCATGRHGTQSFIERH